ncbi:MAG: ATP-dependent helicase [Roseburia lenta]|nr:ATP-dependent helicase [Roseburia lenta]
MLNDQQLAAVQAIEEPTLLLAVPGSGKTTVLVTRIGYMVYCKGIAPEEILVVTYNVAAKSDMQRRCKKMFGEDLSMRVEFRTINGICAKAIAMYSRMVGKQAFELLSDEGEKARILAGIYQRIEHGFPSENDLSDLATRITYIKNRMLSKEEIARLNAECDYDLAKIYEAYRREMRARSLMDFDDQLVYAYTMFRSAPALLDSFWDRYSYIMVDEAQDTSKIQHAIIELLAGREHHLFMVGDEDQSIYGFRAAYPEALLSFEDRYPGARVLLMETNYRSDAGIVAAADAFIRQNSLRHEKHMRPWHQEAGTIRTIDIARRKGQYGYLLKVARNLMEKDAEDQKTTAVLYRDNESALPLIDLLEKQEIPYRIKNAEISFFSHRIVNDIRNIILFAADTTNTELFLQIYYKLQFFIKKADAEAICAQAKREEISVFDAALSYYGEGDWTAGKVKAMRTHMANMMREPADKALFRILNPMGYLDYVERSRLKNTKTEILQMLAQGERSPLALVERLDALAEILRNKEDDKEAKLVLSTIHSSKGLEYDTVYLLDVADGLFPETVLTSYRSADKEEIAAYEEERRLFYVGVTRAKENLILFHAKTKSTFLEQFLPDLRGSEAEAEHIAKRPNPKKTSLQADGQKALARFASSRESYSKQGIIPTVHPGDIVLHSKYGRGEVGALLEKSGKIRISFDGVNKTFAYPSVFLNGNLVVEEE